MNRRKFLENASLLGSTLAIKPSLLKSAREKNTLMSVLGPVDPSDLGITLIHEHAMVDFIGAAETGPHRYDPDIVFQKVLPHFLELKKFGCKTFVDCTPAYLGRDVHVLKRLSQASGLNVLTNTGYYGAAKEKYVPAHAYKETEQQLAARWIDEWKNGIEGSGVYPGFIKTSVDEGPICEVCVKILRAVALTHLQTGLSISAHTGNGEAALQELEILTKSGVHPSAFRWVHAQNEKDKDLYIRVAKMGAWIELDGINVADGESTSHHLECVRYMKSKGLLNKILVSQDAGWYAIGEPNGGTFRSFTGIFEKFVPALKEADFSEDDVHQLLVRNPRESLTVKVRKI